MQLAYGNIIHLGYNDIMQILKDHLEKERGFATDSLHVNIVQEVCGMGESSHQCHNFKGVTFYGNPVDAHPQSKVGESK